MSTAKPAWLVALGCALLVGPAGADVVQLEQRLIVAIEPDEAQAGDDLILLQPGFRLPMATEEVQKQVNNFNKHLAVQDYGKAFRVLSELRDDQLQTMVPVGGKGLHVAVREQLQRQLLTLPPDGLRAFRLYFDGQAREMLDEVRNHPRPGSEDQLARAQALVDRLLASSVGGEAVSLLGDLYFERGGFARAERCWAIALQQGLASGDQELALQTKRVIAKQRNGDEGEAAALYQELKARYSDSDIVIGGQPVDALALLGSTLGTVQNDTKDDTLGDTGPLVLPDEGAMPAWHLRFLDDTWSSNTSSQGGRYSYYRGPETLQRIVPPVVADDQHVYFHWLDVVFALDRDSGKILWKRGSMLSTSRSFPTRLSSNSGDPRNYSLQLAGDALLLTASHGDGAAGVFTLTAQDRKNGMVLWSSDTHPEWPLRDDKGTPQQTTVIGKVLAVGNTAYTVVHRKGQTKCYLRRFVPETGEVLSTIELGEADPLSFRYTNIRLMPQPQMLAHEGMLLVLMGNGALTSVDVTAGQIAWALRLDTPLGVGGDANQRSSLTNQLNNQANPNGSGALVMADGVLYAKQHRGDTLFAVDPMTGEVAWTLDSLDADAKLVGVSDSHFFLMNRLLRGYKLDDERGKIWDTEPRNSGLPDQAAVLFNQRQLMVYEQKQLKLIDPGTGRTVSTFKNEKYLGETGGRLYRLDDLLVCIDKRRITAFRVEPGQDGP